MKTLLTSIVFITLIINSLQSQIYPDSLSYGTNGYETYELPFSSISTTANKATFNTETQQYNYIVSNRLTFLNYNGSVDSLTIEANLLLSHDSASSLGFTYLNDTVLIGKTSSFNVAKFTLNGEVDNNFGNNGFARTTILGTGQSSRNTLLLENGKFLLSGYLSHPDDLNYVTRFAVVRLNADGSIDETFNESGSTSIYMTQANNEQSALGVLSNGKIVIGGKVRSSYNGNGDFGLVRIHDDGQIDSTFGTNGIVKTAVGNASDYPYHIIEKENGKILVLGECYTSGFVPCAVQYDISGNLDMEFGNNGKWVSSTGYIPNPSYHASNYLRVDNDRLLLSSGSGELLMFNMDGSIDNTFGDNGTVNLHHYIPNFLRLDPSLFIKHNDGSFWLLGVSMDSSFSQTNFTIRAFMESNITVDLEKINSQEEYIVFPNPLQSNVINITLKNVQKHQIRSMKLMDINGREIQNLNVMQMFVSGENLRIPIDQHLTKGLYLLELRTDTEKILLRVIK